MNPMLLAPLYAALLCVGMLVLLEVGRRLGLRRLGRDPQGARTGAGAVDGAVFGLLGLLIAFTFSGAASRFDSRRELVVEEANNIGTAWLRIDLLPAEAQPELRELFRRYLDSRLETHRRLPDLAAAREELNRSFELQNDIWTHAVRSCQQANSTTATMLLLPALNDMIDILTTQNMASLIHPPLIIYIMLGVLALAAALLAGHAMAGGKTRNWVHLLTFAVVMAATVYVILDIEYPRLGLIRVDAVDQVLADLRRSMG
jgi:hypothetical protein